MGVRTRRTPERAAEGLVPAPAAAHRPETRSCGALVVPLALAGHARRVAILSWGWGRGALFRRVPRLTQLGLAARRCALHSPGGRTPHRILLLWAPEAPANTLFVAPAGCELQLRSLGGEPQGSRVGRGPESLAPVHTAKRRWGPGAEEQNRQPSVAQPAPFTGNPVVG